MLRPKTLIHMLVSLALTLNGIGAAMASVGMAMAAVGTTAPVEEQAEKHADPQEGAMQSGCHELDSSRSISGEDDSTDCCEDGGCGCGCAHQSQVVLTATFLVTPAIAPASIHLERLAPPLSPSLSRPVRPPIA